MSENAHVDIFVKRMSESSFN